MSELMINSLRQIIKENGKEILTENIDRVYSLLTDLVPKEDIQRRCIRLALRSEAMKPLYSISETPDNLEALLKKSVVIAADENCWKDEVAYDTMFSLFSALYPELAESMAESSAESNINSAGKFTEGFSEIADENQLDGYEYDDEDYSRTWALEFIENEDGYVISKYTAFGHEDIIELPVMYKGKPVVGIGSSVFENADIDFIKGNSIKNIGDSAFQDCQFTSFDFTRLVTIGAHAFDSCNKLTVIYLADSVESIGERAFANIDIQKIVLSSKLKEIGAEDLDRCKSIFVPGIKTEIKPCYLYFQLISYLNNSTIFCHINSRAYLFAKQYNIKCLPLPKNFKDH